MNMTKQDQNQWEKVKDHLYVLFNQTHYNCLRNNQKMINKQQQEHQKINKINHYLHHQNT